MVPFFCGVRLVVGVGLCSFGVSILYFGSLSVPYILFYDIFIDSMCIVLYTLGHETLLVHFHDQ